MTTKPPLPRCPHPACEQPHVIRNGSHNGRQRYECRGCGRFFGETEGTPMYHLHTPAAEVAQALLVVMRRGSLRAAEEITGHKYETIGEWLRRASEHAQALTDIFTQDLHLSTVEIDEFWSFVRKKTAGRTAQMQANDGDASCKTAPAASSLPVPAVRIGEDLVERAVTLTVTRTLGRPVDWCSDGWRGYKAILTRAYRQPVHTGRPGRPSLQVSPDVRLTQTIKHRDSRGAWRAPPQTRNHPY